MLITVFTQGSTQESNTNLKVSDSYGLGLNYATVVCCTLLMLKQRLSARNSGDWTHNYIVIAQSKKFTILSLHETRKHYEPPVGFPKDFRGYLLFILCVTTLSKYKPGFGMNDRDSDPLVSIPRLPLKRTLLPIIGYGRCFFGGTFAEAWV